MYVCIGGGGYPNASSFYVNATLFESWVTKLPALPASSSSSSSSSSSNDGKGVNGKKGESKESEKTKEKAKKVWSKKDDTSISNGVAVADNTTTSSLHDSKKHREYQEPKGTRDMAAIPAASLSSSTTTNGEEVKRSVVAVKLTLPVNIPVPPKYTDGTSVITSMRGLFPQMGAHASCTSKEPFPMLTILRQAIDGCTDFQEKVYDTHRTFHYNK
jgi:hypothetical protein